MMEFKFDLQLFAVGALDWTTNITVTDPGASGTTKTLYVSNAATPVVTVANPGSYIAVITFSQNTAYTSGSTTVSSQYLSKIEISSQISTKLTLPSNVISVTDTGATKTVFTLDGTGTFTGDSFTTTSSSSLSAGTNVSVTASTVKAEKFTGTVKDAAGLATLSGVTGNLGVAGAAILDDFTAGTVTTDAAFNDKIANATITGASTVTTTNGESYTLTLKGTAQSANLNTTDKPFNVIGTSGADQVTLKGSNADTVSAGAGSDKITINSGTGVVSIDGGAGNDTIISSANLGDGSVLRGGDGKDVFDLKATTTTNGSTFDGGAGDDSIVAGEATTNTITYSTILGGAGADTITGFNATNVVTGGEGADVFDLNTDKAKLNISDYAYGTDSIYVTSATDANVNTFVTTNNALTSDGTSGFITTATGDVGPTNGSSATISSSSGFFAVSLADNAANKVDVGWVGTNGTTINGGSQTKKMVLTGRTNSESDLLIGGSKADTLYAGTGDSVYGGAGKDVLDVTGTTNVYVGIATDSGEDAVTGFTSGFDIDAADAVYMVSGSATDMDVEVGAADVVVKDGSSAKLTLTGEATQVGGTTNTFNLLIGTAKVAAAQTDTMMVLDDLSYADVYVGTYDKTNKTNSGMNLSAVTDALSVDLSDTSKFRKIDSVVGGSGNTTLMGGANAESLVAASGSTTSLYGGAGKDTLVSSGDSKTEFFFMNGAGNDTIQGFTTGTDTDTSDVLNFYGSALGSISRTDGNVFKVKTSDGSTLTVNQVTNSEDEKIQWVSGSATGVAKVAATSGSSLSYETDVTTYFGSSKKDTLTVGAGDGADVNIWLDGSQGVGYSDIDVVDASGRAGNTTIAGSAIAETITGGSGNSSVWGGAGQVADVLKSTSGSTTMFFYGLGNGSDSISGSSSDTVNLFDLDLSKIASANIQNSQVIFTTSSNDTVTVSGAQTFQLSDGSKWTANYSTNQWEAAQ